MELIILTGMSGAGKSQACDFFEDQGFFCIDNLPPLILPELAKTPADHVITDDTLRENFDKWIEQYAVEKMSIDHTMHKDKFIYLVHVGDLYDGNQKRGFLIEITDDTEHQERVEDIERYNMTLNRELMAKAKKIKELESQKESSAKD